MKPSPAPPPPSGPPPRHRLRRVVLWSGGVLLLFALLLGAAFWFLLGTQGGTRFLFTRLGALMPGTLSVRELTGPLGGPLDLRGLVYEREGLSMRIEHVRLEWRLRELLSRRLDIEKLWAEGIRIIPKPSKEPQKERGPLPDVNLRFNILVRDARVTDLRIGEGAQALIIDRIDLATRVVGNRFRIERFTVRSPTLDGQIAGAFQPQGDYPVDLNLEWTVRGPGIAAPFTGRGTATGTLERLRVRQTLAAPFAARLDAELLQPLYNLRFDGKLAFSGFNPRLLRKDLPDLPASGEVAVQGTVDTFASSGSVRADVKIADAGRVAAIYSVRREGARWRIDRAAVTLPGTPTRLDLSGVVAAPAGQPPEFQGKARWTGLRWPLRPTPGGATDLVVASSRGEASLSGKLDAYHADLWADLTQAPGGTLLQGRWTLAGDGTSERFRLARFQGTALSGRIEGTGEAAWKPQVRWNLALRGSGIDPQALAADFPGDLSFEATTRGSLAAAGPVGTVSLPRVRGTLRGQLVAAAADLDLRGQLYDLRHFDLTWGTANLAAAGHVAPRLDLAWKLSAPNLGIAVPQGGGSVVAEGRLSGPPQAPRIEVHARGEGVRIGTTSVARAALDGNVDLAPGGLVVLDMRSTDVRSATQRLGELTVSARGTQGSHALTIAAVSENGRLDAAFAGGLSGGLSAQTAWSGTIQRLDLYSKPTGTWSLEAPAELSASVAAVRLRGFCWRSGGARLCADGGWAQAGAWDVAAQLSDLPLNTFRPVLPTDLQITGDLDGSVSARGQGPVLANADVDLRPSAGELRFPGPQGRPVSFHYEKAMIQAQAGAGGAGRATAGVTLTGVGSVSARADVPRIVPGTPWQRLPLGGRIDVDLRNLAFVEGFVPDLNRPAGTLAGGYTLSGTLGDPRFVGTARLADGSADLPLLGLHLRQIQLTATGDGSGALAIDASVHSGPGILTIKGKAGVPGPETPVRLAIQGKRFQISDTDEIDAVVSPDLTLTAGGKRIELTGEVVIPEAKVDIEKRRPKGAVRASQDVVFVNAGAAPAPNEKMALSARVRLVLGRDVDVTAFGLKAKPTGSLLVIEEPRRVTRGVGELEMQQGTFKAYGQDLTIERGRLIFNGPIVNPGLDVRAYRKAEDGTTAGIEAKGTAQAPQVTLWSDPPMTQSEALAYLLLGHPLHQAQAEEGDRLANAATSLGLKGGNLLAKKLAARFGLEEARIEGKTLDQAALVVGKYLSPRLYVAYGIGLFEPVNSFRIRYLLSRKITLQAERGDGLSADALYTVER